MYIRRLIIDDFGALQKRHVMLSEGFNLITGKNESGKSTLCAFIKYVFYGFNDSRERQRCVNFDTMRASGSIELEFKGELYLISRKDGEKGKTNVIVTRMDGSEFSDWKLSASNPGEYFFGIPEKLYSRSIYVSQIGGAAPDIGTASAISNLLISGDEAVNLKNASNKLDSFRKSLQLKKGRGGLIHESEDRITELKEEYESALDVKKKCESLASEINDTEEHLTELQTELSQAEKTLEKTKALKIRSYIKETERLESALKDTTAELESLTENNTLNGFCPDDGYLSEIKTLESETALREQTCEGLKKRLIESEDERNSRIPKEYRQFLALGRTKGIEAAYLELTKKIKTLFILSAVCFALFVGSLIAAIFNVFFAIPATISLCLGIIFSYISISTDKRKKAFLLSLSPDGLSYEEVCAACEEYETYRASEATSISRAYNDELELLTKKQEELEALIEKWGKGSSNEVKCAYAEFSEKKAELIKDISFIQKSIEVHQAHLSAYSVLEKERAASFTDEELNIIDPRPVSEERIHTLKHSVSALEGQLSGLRVSLASAGFDSVDPVKTLCEIDEEKKRYENLTEIFEAVNLAISALNDAENSVRETVSPYLSHNSGEYFRSITDGRYSSLLLDTSLSLKYLSPEHSAPISEEYLSGGSADLAWLCLRLALHKKLSESYPLPLILDECLVYFDDERLEKILSMLNKISSDGAQILLFSASTREKAFTAKENKVEL